MAGCGSVQTCANQVISKRRMIAVKKPMDRCAATYDVVGDTALVEFASQPPIGVHALA
jgi:hypothetical protein